MSPLTIYKASAGSGKTFRLTLGYLELLFRDPMSYRHILAVTFTNKAASEMKSRILDRLYAMSQLNDDEASPDIDLLAATTNLSRQEIISRAGELLVRILNDYSRFSVGTIDRFFQGVIRAFTWEIGLPAGFSLELDRDRILGEAVDRMFMELGEDRDLLDWMLRLAESRIEASKGWNFKSEIISLGQELFSEAYQEVMLNREPGPGRERLNAFVSELSAFLESRQGDIRAIAGKTVAKMNSAGWSADDFQLKSRGPAGFFEKAAAGQRYDLTDGQKTAMTDLSKWISKNESNQEKIQFAESVLMPAIAAIYEKWVYLNSATEISQNIFALGILGDISKKILEITDEKNLFMLSDASRFLKGLIGSNPAPFIYEKTGSFIDHIMLDEFQDTSVFQWENFRPLLEHTLSTGKENIVVGDVKQSIYRWRNSDWKILADVVGKSFGAHQITQLPLDENWRSNELLIRFNNTLFSTAPPIIRNIIDQSLDGALVSEEFKNRWAGLLDTAYEEVQQQIPQKSLGSGGYIRAEVLQDEEKKQQEIALERIPEWIRELQDAGYEAGEIAILVRTNREGAEVADVLMSLVQEGDEGAYNYNFVSNESLFLNHNTAVKFLICLLKHLQNSQDDLNNISLIYYHRLLFAGDAENPSVALHPGNSVDQELGEVFSSRKAELKRLPLFELTENLIDIFGIDKRLPDLPYIQAFQEIILGLQQDEPGSLHDFISYWDDHGHKKSITVSEDQDALRIITIHKAKGLQYKAVIVPFCNWELTTSASGNRETILWCSTEGTPFDKVPVVPLKFTKRIGETIFAAHYLEELIMGYVDSMNILYVALTRAEEAMIIGLPEPDPKGALKKSGHLVMQSVHAAPRTPGKLQMDLSAAAGDTGFEIGTLRPGKRELKQSPAPWIVESYPVNFRTDRIRLRLKSADYYALSVDPAGAAGATTDPTAGPASDLATDPASRPATDPTTHPTTGHLDFGNIMHEIFGMIRTAGDIDKAVAKFHREGLLNAADSEKISAMITARLQHPDVVPWFTQGIIVLNERDIITGGETYRPDRVMIDGDKAIVADYKFGDQELAKYDRQVARYKQLLNEIGYTDVEGYIWYVMLNKVVKV
ncbi:MAG: UvrD-helicase domain-containing protein [Bacteroidales bacterium]